MKTRVSALFFGLTLSVMVIGSASAAAKGNINLLAGQKLLNDDWKDPSVGYDVSEQNEFGVMFDIRKESWPLNLSVDYLASEEKSSNILNGGGSVKGTTSEWAAGVRKYFLEDRMVRPYVGAGVAYITGKVTVGVQIAGTPISSEDKKSKLGPWVGGGMVIAIKWLNIGFDARYSKAKTDELGEMGGYHLNGLLGVNF